MFKKLFIWISKFLYRYYDILDPMLWTSYDIVNWLRWAENQYDLGENNVNRFPSTGGRLCELSR